MQLQHCQAPRTHRCFDEQQPKLYLSRELSAGLMCDVVARKASGGVVTAVCQRRWARMPRMEASFLQLTGRPGRASTATCNLLGVLRAQGAPAYLEGRSSLQQLCSQRLQKTAGNQVGGT